MERTSLVRFAWLSIAAACVTITLKVAAYLLSGSIGLLSDALESGVNLIAAIVALGALAVAARPPDQQHHFGHEKAEYFSSGVEGALILVAACSIVYTSVQRLLNLQPLEQVGVGLVASTAASAVNFVVARILLQAGRSYHSITLEADSQHLMTDVWTSVGVIVGVAAVAITGWLWLDPIIALLVGLNIVRSGWQLIRRSIQGLMDSAIAPDEQAKIEAILNTFQDEGVEWHQLQTRQSGARRFITLHVLVPGEWSVRTGHDLIERLEQEIGQAIPEAIITTHLEPIPGTTPGNDPARSAIEP